MMMIEPVAHGGALARAVRRHGGQRADWLDLSTGINPVPAPLPASSERLWQALPDEDLTEACLDAARRCYGVPQASALVAAPGVQALIQLLPSLRPGATAAVLSPTYGEYSHVFSTLGAGSRSVDSISALNAAGIAIIVNPNNPDGRILAPGELLAMAESQAAKGGLLVVDEAFCDLTPDLSVARHAGMRGLLVLKSFGKFFGLAGVRLGFAAGHADDVGVLASHLGPWAVSGPALAAGAHCLGDDVLVAQTAEAIRANSALQKALLAEAGLPVIADAGLFHLVDVADAAALHEGLARQHILTRIFGFNPHWLRLGLCADGTQRARLASALKACLTPAP
jgi:cobalamin biosynthetic protein CobC